MRPFLFLVVLEGHTQKVLAFEEEAAVILAQAEAIKQGKKYNLLSVKNLYYSDSSAV